MRADKEKALQLRSSGKSYKEILRALGVPKSTLSDWLHHTRWSNKISRILTEKAKSGNKIRIQRLNKIRGERLAKLYETARKEARDEFEHFKLHPLFTTGLAIYWGEGDRLTRHQIRVGNVDSAMLRLFVRFLQEICGLSKRSIRAYVMIYPDLDPENCTGFWSKKLGLSLANFNKCVTIKGRHKTKRLPYGVCYVGLGSTYLKEKIMVWLGLLPKELAKGKYYPRE